MVVSLRVEQTSLYVPIFNCNHVLMVEEGEGGYANLGRNHMKHLPPQLQI